MSQSINAIMGDHHGHNQECMGILPDSRCRNKLATATAQIEMPCMVQTKEKPVVLMIAPQTILTDPDSEAARRELAAMRAA